MTKLERFKAKAHELARLGRFDGWQPVACELQFDDGFNDAREWLFKLSRVLISLGSILADAQEQGLTASDAVRELRRNRRRGEEHNAEKRQKGKLKVGVDIPTPNYGCDDGANSGAYSNERSGNEGWGSGVSHQTVSRD
jgi:hypothetical protein